MFTETLPSILTPKTFNVLPARGSTRILMPVPDLQWREPSIALPRDDFGRPVVRTKFLLRARLHDGHIAVWTFKDRYDADAFFFSLMQSKFSGLPMPREDCQLPTPRFDPDMIPGLEFELAPFTQFTAQGTATWTSPLDWNNSSNLIELIGGGASGGHATASTNMHCTGGGAGAYRNLVNFVVATPGTTTAAYKVANSVSGVTGTTANGFDGSSSYWDGAAVATATAGANGGAHGVFGTGNQSGGSGASLASTSGTNGGAGGRGGNLTGASGMGASGGGSPGYPTSVSVHTGNTGNSGGDSSSTGTPVTTSGGSSVNSGLFGGGSGSGGGTGGNGATAAVGGSGNTYGAGGGGNANSALASGGGAQGTVGVLYTAAATGNALLVSR